MALLISLLTRVSVINPVKWGLEKNLRVLKKFSKIWWGPCRLLIDLLIHVCNSLISSHYHRLREMLGSGKEGDVLKKMLVPNLGGSKSKYGGSKP